MENEKKKRDENISRTQKLCEHYSVIEKKI